MLNKHVSAIRFMCLSFCMALLATHARAEDPIETAVAHIGVGAGINFYDPTNSNSKNANGIAVAYRWHSFHSGWGPTFGLDWHNSDFTEPLGSADVPFGNLRMRALLAGYGHTRRLKRLTASGGVSVGYSFNHFTVDSAAGPAFERTGVALTDVHVRDSAMLKPDVALWYDVAKHVGVGISAAYLVNRPDQIITTGTGSTTRHLNADTFELTVGLTFGVWRKKA